MKSRLIGFSNNPIREYLPRFLPAPAQDRRPLRSPYCLRQQILGEQA
jgi:hypothetical protein